MWDLVQNVLAVLGALASIAGIVVLAIQRDRLRRWRREITWDDSLRVAERLLEQIEASGWKPDVVVGIGRSGGIWGGWLAGNLGSLPFAVVDDRYPKVDGPVRIEYRRDLLALLCEVYPELAQLGQPKVLVIEGATSRGTTFEVFRKRYAEELRSWDARFAVLYKSPVSTAELDYVGLVGPELWPKKFPWHRREAYRPYLRDIFEAKRAA